MTPDRGTSSLLMVEARCCERMADAVASECDEHPNRWDCPDALGGYWPKLREYGLLVHDGGSSMVVIEHCPWCGVRLPASLRDEWFDELERLGVDPDGEVPEGFLTDAWWRSSATTYSGVRAYSMEGGVGITQGWLEKATLVHGRRLIASTSGEMQLGCATALTPEPLVRGA
jgi:hypothetical protein